jgi:hypothetical protein
MAYRAQGVANTVGITKVGPCPGSAGPRGRIRDARNDMAAPRA